MKAFGRNVYRLLHQDDLNETVPYYALFSKRDRTIESKARVIGSTFTWSFFAGSMGGLIFGRSHMFVTGTKFAAPIAAFGILNYGMKMLIASSFEKMFPSEDGDDKRYAQVYEHPGTRVVAAGLAAGLPRIFGGFRHAGRFAAYGAGAIGCFVLWESFLDTLENEKEESL